MVRVGYMGYTGRGGHESFTSANSQTRTLSRHNQSVLLEGASVKRRRLTGALLDRLTHHAHVLEMNGDSYRLKNSKSRRGPTAARDPSSA